MLRSNNLCALAQFINPQDLIHCKKDGNQPSFLHCVTSRIFNIHYKGDTAVAHPLRFGQSGQPYHKNSYRLHRRYT